MLLITILYFSRDQLHKVSEIKHFAIDTIIMISGFFLLSQLVFGYQLKNILIAFNIQTNFIEWFGLIAIQSMGNYLPLSSGTISKIAYLKINKRLPVSDYLGYLVGDTFLKFSIYGVIGTSFIIGNYFWTNQINMTLVLITGVFFLIGVFVITFQSAKSNSKNKIILWIIDLHSGWLKIRRNRKVLIISIFTHLLFVLFISIQYYLIFKEINIRVDLLSILLLTIITNLLQIASIFPGNVGLRESVSGIVLQLTGLPFGVGVIVSLMARLISMFWIFLLGSFFSGILLSKKYKYSASPQDNNKPH